MKIDSVIGVAIATVLALTIPLILPSFLIQKLSSSELNEVNDAKERISLQSERLRLRNEMRTTFLQVITALVLIVGAYFTWNQIQDNQKAIQANLRSQQQQQLTDAFNKAVEQLGKTDDSVRVGALHALKRIADSFPDQRSAVADIYSSYIRIQSPWPPGKKDPYQPSVPFGEIPFMRSRAPDVQVALTLLGNLSNDARQFDIVLTRVDLRRADLRNLHFEGTDFRNSHLENADIEKAHFESTALGGANFSRADISEIYISNAWEDKRTIWPYKFDKARARLNTCDPKVTKRPYLAHCTD
jgi:uncharacterized protein YjbI with pentapeptide repeats